MPSNKPARQPWAALSWQTFSSIWTCTAGSDCVLCACSWPLLVCMTWAAVTVSLAQVDYVVKIATPAGQACSLTGVPGSSFNAAHSFSPQRGTLQQSCCRCSGGCTDALRLYRSVTAAKYAQNIRSVTFLLPAVNNLASSDACSCKPSSWAGNALSTGRPCGLKQEPWFEKVHRPWQRLAVAQRAACMRLTCPARWS